MSINSNIGFNISPPGFRRTGFIGRSSRPTPIGYIGPPIREGGPPPRWLHVDPPEGVETRRVPLGNRVYLNGPGKSSGLGVRLERGFPRRGNINPFQSGRYLMGGLSGLSGIVGRVTTQGGARGIITPAGDFYAYTGGALRAGEGENIAISEEYLQKIGPAAVITPPIIAPIAPPDTTPPVVPPITPPPTPGATPGGLPIGTGTNFDQQKEYLRTHGGYGSPEYIAMTAAGKARLTPEAIAAAQAGYQYQLTTYLTPSTVIAAAPANRQVGLKAGVNITPAMVEAQIAALRSAPGAGVNAISIPGSAPGMRYIF